MRVKEVRVSNGFKRFSDLTVGPLPEASRLVVLLGANGSGKSSFFEALLYWHKHNWNRHVRRHLEPYYYERPAQKDPPSVDVQMHGEVPSDTEGRARAFHFRSAYRYTSDFKSSSIGQLTAIEKANPIDGLVDEDRSVAEHYNRLVGKAVSAFTNIATSITNTEVYANDVTPLADSFERLFPDLRLTSLGDPTDEGTFLFTKGVVENFRYVNLSSGEKAAFDLLLDFHIRKLTYPDSIVCVDEPEAHIGLRVQRQLLDEMLKVLPLGCQLWIATHSVGMMRRAFEMAMTDPDDVVFLDFGDKDYDHQVAILPSVADRSLWAKVHEVALEDLASLVAPAAVYLCEGDPTATTESRRSFDATVFARIFGDTYPGTEFISVGGVTIQPTISQSVVTLLPGTKVCRVMDRDSRTEQAIADLVASDPTVRVLSVRDLENYLLSDEVLALGSDKYADDPTSVATSLVTTKAALLAGQKYPDDVKAIAGQLFDEVKKHWKMSQPGQDRHEFMRDVCAPLVTVGTDTYEAIRTDLQLPTAQ